VRSVPSGGARFPQLVATVNGFIDLSFGINQAYRKLSIIVRFYNSSWLTRPSRPSPAVTVRDFYARKIATVRSLVALPISHRFAAERQVSLSQLKGETFVRGSDDEVPGYTQRIIQFCRKYGGFRPRLVTIDKFNSLVESLSLAANEEAISIQPAFISHLDVPNVVMVPIADAGATWDLFVVWQQGKIASPLRTLLSELNLKSQ